MAEYARKADQSQEALGNYFNAVAKQLRKIYRYPYLSIEIVAMAKGNALWNPRAADEGYHYTAIIPFDDPDRRLADHKELGALACYHIAGDVGTTAFFLRIPVTPYLIENGRIKHIINYIESVVGARFIAGESPSPLFAGYSGLVQCRLHQVPLTAFSDVIGVDMSQEPKRAGKWNGRAGGIARGKDITAVADKRVADIFSLKSQSKSNAEIACELGISIRTVQRSLLKATPAVVVPRKATTGGVAPNPSSASAPDEVATAGVASHQSSASAPDAIVDASGNPPTIYPFEPSPHELALMEFFEWDA